jgi:hypothetical protein
MEHERKKPEKHKIHKNSGTQANNGRWELFLCSYRLPFLLFFDKGATHFQRASHLIFTFLHVIEIGTQFQ